MTKEQVTLLVDTREQDEEENVFDAVERNEGVESWSLSHLEAGDFLVEEASVVMERKTMSDYASSILKGRLGEQIEKMQDTGMAPYILVEDDLSEAEELSHTQLAPESIRGHMASTMAREGIPVIPCSDLDTLIDMTVRLGRKYVEEPGSEQLSSGTLGKDVPAAKRIYGAIPNVGPSMADKLYENFPTVIQLVHATDKEILDIDGAGPKTVENIEQSLRE